MNTSRSVSLFCKLSAALVLSAALASCASDGSSSTSSSDSSTAENTAYQTKNTSPTPKKPAISNGKTLVIAPISFASDANVSNAVLNECQLPENLASFIKDAAWGQYENIIIDGSKAPRNAEVLNIEISDLRGGKGGGWSGPKYVSVKGTLTKRGSTLGTFKGRRTSMGGAFGTFKSTCSILGRCIKTLGTDVSQWLENPAKKSNLGD